MKSLFYKTIIYFMEDKKLNIRNIFYSMPVHKLFYLFICLFIIIISLFGILITFTNKYTTNIPASGGIYKVASINNVRYIDPIFSNNDTEIAISKLIYSGLLRKDGEKYTYDIAESITRSTDGLIINIKLKKTKFSDDSELTSSDVAYTIETIQDSLINSPRHKDWKNIEIVIVDSQNIILQLKFGISNIEEILTQGIVKKSEWITLPKGSLSLSNLNINAIGAGPYKLKSTLEQNKVISQINLEINNNYKTLNSLPYIQSIVFKIFSDKADIYTTIKNGEIYTSVGIDPSELTSMVKSNNNIKIISSKMYRSFGLFLNPNNDKNLTDVNYRSDLRNSIDIDKIVNNVLNGYGNRASYIYNKNYDNPIANTYILNKNNYENRNIDIYTVNNPDLIKVANIIKDDWLKIGIIANIKTFELGEFHQDVVKNRNFSVLLFAIDTYSSKDIYNLWHSSARTYPGSNITNYYSLTLDNNLEALVDVSNNLINMNNTINIQEIDINKQKEITLYNNINDELYKNIAWIPLYNPYLIISADKDLKINNATNIYNSYEFIESITSAYINTEKVYSVFLYDKVYKKISDFVH